MLRMVDPVDDTYRRQMNRQLTGQESRHKPARDVCHGKRGTIHQPYRDGNRQGPETHKLSPTTAEARWTRGGRRHLAEHGTARRRAP